MRRLMDADWAPPNSGPLEGESPLSDISITNERTIAALCLALGAESIGPLSTAEAKLLVDLPNVPFDQVRAVQQNIARGFDPLGAAFAAVRSAEERRKSGAISTSQQIVAAMLDWAETAGVPKRIIEPGAGSAPFLIGAARRFPDAS